MNFQNQVISLTSSIGNITPVLPILFLKIEGTLPVHSIQPALS